MLLNILPYSTFLQLATQRISHLGDNNKRLTSDLSLLSELTGSFTNFGMMLLHFDHLWKTFDLLTVCPPVVRSVQKLPRRSEQDEASFIDQET